MLQTYHVAAILTHDNRATVRVAHSKAALGEHDTAIVVSAETWRDAAAVMIRRLYRGSEELGRRVS